jgi:hypothetical protein
MKNKTNNSIKSFALAGSLALASILSLPVYAEGGSVHHSGQASKHSVLAVAHGVGDSAKVASAVVAAPIIVAGGVSLATGSAAISVGESIGNSAQNVSNHHAQKHNTQLTITEITITADPAPNQIAPKTTQQTTIEVKETTSFKELK